jgi:hypothetical protein
MFHTCGGFSNTLALLSIRIIAGLILGPAGSIFGAPMRTMVERCAGHRFDGNVTGISLKDGGCLRKRPLTFGYVAFYILFWPDTWQIAIGLLTTWLLTPRIAPPDLGFWGTLLLYLMVAGIGYAASAAIVRPIFRRLHGQMLARRRP